MGINRLSIGMQSASNAELKMLSRIHSFEEVQQSVNWAREAGFENLSLDLIYGLPGQTIEQWSENLQAALTLGSEHLSLYALSLEPEVPMFRQIQRGILAQQDDDLMADMYELATETLEQASFEQYEISNWSRRTPDRRICAAGIIYSTGSTCPILVLAPARMAMPPACAQKTCCASTLLSNDVQSQREREDSRAGRRLKQQRPSTSGVRCRKPCCLACA